MTKDRVIDTIERMAENGTAPEDSCSLFSVGLDDPLSRLRNVYLKKAFARGRSAEKFVIGPFGSGKTHFLRQLQGVAAKENCAVAEIQLNRDVDFTDPLAVYQEIAGHIRAPGQKGQGLNSLLRFALQRVMSSVPDIDVAEQLGRDWIKELEQATFELESIGRMYGQALRALLEGQSEYFDLTSHWLSGAFSDRPACKQLGLSPITKSEHRRYGHKAALSLYQFVRRCGFPGTVVCFDEAEQSLGLDRKRMHNVLSTLQSGINAVADLTDGSALIVFAITPDVADQLKEFPALQQRLVDPGPDMSFFQGGNTRAALIDLSERQAAIEEELTSIADKLVSLYAEASGKLGAEIASLRAECCSIAEQVASSEVGASIRRTLTKRVCTTIMTFDDDSWSPTASEEDEV